MQTKILVLGATGYVGGRLIQRLLDSGYNVRAVGRSLAKLESRPWAHHPNIELMAADILNPADITNALKQITHAYYFIHSMNPYNQDFAKTDRDGAHNFVEAANQTETLQQVIYLGGLGEDKPDLSKHLRSRSEVADILKTGKVPVTIYRAAMIIGSGSASFEILRYLVEHLPIMITPRWIDTKCQPISIRNVLFYLVQALSTPETRGNMYDIGGADIVTYRELMRIYCEESGLGMRWIIPVPVFTPKLSSYWINFITPVPSYIARPLAEGLRNPVICEDNRILQLIPQPLFDCREAIRKAIECVNNDDIESHWTDAGAVFVPEWIYPGDPVWAGGTAYKDERSIIINAPISDVWKTIVKLGGDTGWYYGNWLWRLRGLLDMCFGGMGLRQTRKASDDLRVGDALDFWRVVNCTENNELLLLAEMKLPGQALLEFKLKKLSDGNTELTQTARFLPRGLLGIAYWWAVFPLHHFVFNGMLRGIATASNVSTIDVGR